MGYVDIFDGKEKKEKRSKGGTTLEGAIGDTLGRQHKQREESRINTGEKRGASLLGAMGPYYPGKKKVHA